MSHHVEIDITWFKWSILQTFTLKHCVESFFFITDQYRETEHNELTIEMQAMTDVEFFYEMFTLHAGTYYYLYMLTRLLHDGEPKTNVSWKKLAKVNDASATSKTGIIVNKII